jgi:hypothetical protein
MRSDDCAHDHAHAPGERTALDLAAEELFVVGAFRAWVAPVLRPGGDHPDWRDLFRLAGVPAAGAVGFDVLMSVLGASARRPIDVRCTHCPAISPDEEAMLRLVASLQAGEPLSALNVLSDWLAPDAVASALRGAQRFAALTAAAGLRLTSEPGAPATPPMIPVGATLH